jgi:NAD(P)-dependent dehydrogenase (short-subunit alcohol dehydrogenase family)
MSRPPVCVVAGVGPGIGLAVAKRFAREGFTVGLLARRVDALAEYAAEIASEGGAARTYATDLADLDGLASALSAIAEELGPPSVLVYNGAVWRERHPMELPPQEFARDLTLGITGGVACAQEAYPAMKAAGAGTMLFTGGGLALRPETGGDVAALTAAKSGLRGWVHAVAPVLARDGIHVATVTVAGVVAAGTALDPQLIAEAYWTLHVQARDDWQDEIILAPR